MSNRMDRRLAAWLIANQPRSSGLALRLGMLFAVSAVAFVGQANSAWAFAEQATTAFGLTVTGAQLGVGAFGAAAGAGVAAGVDDPKRKLGCVGTGGVVGFGAPELATLF